MILRAARLMPNGKSISRSASHRSLLCAMAVGIAIILTFTIPSRASGAPPRSSAESLFDNFCWNYLVVPCPETYDTYDFYWRPETPFNVLGRPSEWESWVSVVKPLQTHFFYEPAPAGQAGSEDWLVAGFEYNWWVVPGSLWDYGNGESGVGQVFAGPPFPTTFHAYPRSSYGKEDRNPQGEPAFRAVTTVVWLGEVRFWHIMCSVIPPACWIQWEGPFPLLAARTREHPVAVRQVLPMSIGN